MAALRRTKARKSKAREISVLRPKFLDIPAAIRARICKYLFQGLVVRPFYQNFHRRENASNQAAILHTCRKIHEEARPMFYGKAIVKFEQYHTIFHLKHRVGVAARSIELACLQDCELGSQKIEFENIFPRLKKLIVFPNGPTGPSCFPQTEDHQIEKLASNILQQSGNTWLAKTLLYRRRSESIRTFQVILALRFRYHLKRGKPGSQDAGEAMVKCAIDAEEWTLRFYLKGNFYTIQQDQLNAEDVLDGEEMAEWLAGAACAGSD